MFLGGDEIRDPGVGKIECDPLSDYQKMTFVTTGTDRSFSVDADQKGDKIVTQALKFQINVNGRLFIPKHATLAQLNPGVSGLMLPSIPWDLNIISSFNLIYLNLNN